MIPFPAEQISNFHRLLPEIVLCLFGIVIMFADPFVAAANKRILAWVALIGAVAALVSVKVVANDPGPAYSKPFGFCVYEPVQGAPEQAENSKSNSIESRYYSVSVERDRRWFDR